MLKPGLWRYNWDENYHDEGLTLEPGARNVSFIKLSKPFTVAIQPLSTRLIKPNFCFHLSHRRSTTVSLETRNPFENYVVCAFIFTGQQRVINHYQGQIT